MTAISADELLAIHGGTRDPPSGSPAPPPPPRPFIQPWGTPSPSPASRKYWNVPFGLAPTIGGPTVLVPMFSRPAFNRRRFQ